MAGEVGGGAVLQQRREGLLRAAWHRNAGTEVDIQSLRDRAGKRLSRYPFFPARTLEDRFVW